MEYEYAIEKMGWKQTCPKVFEKDNTIFTCFSDGTVGIGIIGGKTNLTVKELEAMYKTAKSIQK